MNAIKSPSAETAYTPALEPGITRAGDRFVYTKGKNPELITTPAQEAYTHFRNSQHSNNKEQTPGDPGLEFINEFLNSFRIGDNTTDSRKEEKRGKTSRDDNQPSEPAFKEKDRETYAKEIAHRAIVEGREAEGSYSTSDRYVIRSVKKYG